jgi:hypothetical protein
MGVSGKPGVRIAIDGVAAKDEQTANRQAKEEHGDKDEVGHDLLEVAENHQETGHCPLKKDGICGSSTRMRPYYGVQEQAGTVLFGHPGRYHPGNDCDRLRSSRTFPLGHL